MADPATIADLVLSGAARIYDLEQPRFAGMPLHPSHHPGYFYALYRRHQDTYNPPRQGPRSSASGVLTMMEHSGTHIDALSHQAENLHLHGDISAAEVTTPYGFRRLGIEEVPPIVARGVLLDLAGLKGVERLPERYAFTADDLEAAESAQGVRVEPGNVLLVRTGFAALWRQPEQYLQAAGASAGASRWAAERGVVAVGADNMAWDAPDERDPETGADLPAHVLLLVRAGIYIIENLNFEELARTRAYTSLFVCLPLKLVGATGSPVRPVAIA
ncbi:MAG: cyclase family protein [Anaerolineae bacterium]